MQSIKDLGTLFPNKDVSITVPQSLRAQLSLQKRRWKEYKILRGWRTPQKEESLNQQGRVTHRVTETEASMHTQVL